eukprot:6825977-Lingulodinium_polyedra.AAC.1
MLPLPRTRPGAPGAEGPEGPRPLLPRVRPGVPCPEGLAPSGLGALSRAACSTGPGALLLP